MATAHKPDRVKARAAAEAVARDSYGRLLATLFKRTGDLADAEDALAGAFVKALETWPTQGPPDNPDAWLLTVAKRRLIDEARKASTRRTSEVSLIARIEALVADEADHSLPDERLSLMLICAHPEIDPTVHTPLMLQMVLGLDAARIGSAFLVKPATMGQRLSRAKARIKAADLSFERPEAAQLPQRLQPVLNAIYAAYGMGWDALGEEGDGAKGLADEARFLAALTAQLCPDSAEAFALCALIEYCEARKPARRGEGGSFIPLSEQDAALWDAMLIDQAEARLRHAMTLRAPGRYGLEAALQSVHVERRLTGRTNWRAAASLYDALVTREDAGFGACVARASAHGEAFGAETALQQLNELSKGGQAYQPYWAALAHWRRVAGQIDKARKAYRRAAALSADPTVRRYLLMQADAL
jgi:RNA polymerase sigma-70 factor (ECF subfamily)